MTPAKHIQNLIENVAADDTAAMDEIDARAWCYKEGHDYKSHKVFGKPDKEGVTYFTGVHIYHSGGDRWNTMAHVSSYTRSLDACQAVMDEHLPGWWICIYQDGEGHGCGLQRPNSTEAIEVTGLPTTPLAFIAAIIQAIEFNREKEKNDE